MMARPQSGSFSQLSKRSVSTSLETRKMPPGLITEEGAWDEDEIHGELSTDKSSQSSEAANNSQVSVVSTTTANYQTMQTMYNESDSQSITKYISPGSSRLVAENAPVKRVQSELAAPITDHPPPPAPLPVDLLAIGWHEGFGLMSALDSLISYQPPYITTSNQTHIVLTRRTPATCPNAFIPDANLKTLVDHIDTIRPMLRKLYDAVFVGVRGLMDIQAEAEKLKPVNFRTGEVERVQGVQTWQDVAREMDRLLDELADTIGFNFP